MRRDHRRIRVVLGYSLASLLLLSGGGCAAVLIGGAVAGGAAAGYAYYKGDSHLDFAADFNQTWAASLTALPDLGMPIVQQSLGGDHGEIQSRTADGEKVTLYLETVQNAQKPLPETRVHVRVGVFGNQPLSQQIHAQISNRLQNPGQVLTPVPANPAGNSVTPPQTGTNGNPPTGVALPKETVPPPLAGTPDPIVPVVRPSTSVGTAIPVSTSTEKSAGK